MFNLPWSTFLALIVVFGTIILTIIWALFKKFEDEEEK